MRGVRALLGVVVTVLVLAIAPHALAQRVVLVRPPATDEALSEAFNRLRAELALQGFETSVAEPGPDLESPDGLSALAQERGAFAGISLSRRVGTSAARICVADRVTGKASIRTITLGRGPDAPNVLAVRTADLLRASLREFAAHERPPPEVVGVDDKTDSEAVERFAQEAPRRFRLDVRFAALGFTQSEGRAFGPSIAFGYRASEWFGFGAFVAGPTLASTIQSDFGSATVHSVLALARFWVFAYGSNVFELRPTLVAGVHHLDARGDVEPPLVSQSAAVTSFAGGGGLEADLRLTDALVISAEVSLLALNPRPAVAVRTDEYRYPLPFATASAGVGVEF